MQRFDSLEKSKL